MPKCRLFSYYHWLCCHMLTGFRHPQQDSCLGCYEFYIYFLLCNLNSRDAATVFERLRTERFSITWTIKACSLKNGRHVGESSLIFTHPVHHPTSHLYQRHSRDFCLLPLQNMNIFTSKKRRKINADQIETLQ